MQNFLKSFPSLVKLPSFGLDLNNIPIDNLHETIKKRVAIFMDRIHRDIYENCLDKQKVKEVIDERIRRYSLNKFLRYKHSTVEGRATTLQRELISAIKECQQIKKELGL